MAKEGVGLDNRRVGLYLVGGAVAMLLLMGLLVDRLFLWPALVGVAIGAVTFLVLRSGHASHQRIKSPQTENARAGSNLCMPTSVKSPKVDLDGLIPQLPPLGNWHAATRQRYTSRGRRYYPRPSR